MVAELSLSSFFHSASLNATVKELLKSVHIAKVVYNKKAELSQRRPRDAMGAMKIFGSP